MKKMMMLALMLLVTLGLIGCDGSLDTESFKLIQPDHEYEIDTWGTNSEVYEFTPRSNKSMSCVMLMLDNGKAMGLQCFQKATTE